MKGTIRFLLGLVLVMVGFGFLEMTSFADALTGFMISAIGLALMLNGKNQILRDMNQ